MPVMAYAFSAGEFLDEELDNEWLDGWEVYNPDSTHPYEWWILK
jgi:hypothetical protein